MPEADCIGKEPPPKPTRIRTSSKTTPPGTINAPMLNGSTSPSTRAPIPLPRYNLRPVVPLDSNNAAHSSLKSQGPPTDNFLATAGQNSLRKTDIPREREASPIAPESNNIPRTSSDTPGRAPLPPPKPKRISLAPQPKAKPLSLQSVPLQPKVDNPVRSTSSPATIPPTANKSAALSLSAPINPERTQGMSQSQELPRPKIASAPLASSSPALVKKPRSAEPSFDGQPVQMDQTPQRLRHQLQPQSSSPPHPPVSASAGARAVMIPTLENSRVDTTLSSSGPTSPGVNPTLLGARSRLRSTSDAKASTSYSVAFPQTTKTMSPPISTVDGGYFASADMRGHSGTSQLPTYPSRHNGGYGEFSDDAQEPGSTAAAATLTASLHKIQALAHEQTERMKQINYSEKKADLAEVVYEKSSVWRARGAEWGGIAKKAWDDRGGMGGIAGGLADRWKRRADGTNEGQQDYSRPGVADQIFGIPLEEAVRLSKISATTGVPAVISRCIEYLDIMGVEEVGLYRVPGSTSNVARLKAMFDHGHDYDFLQKGNAPQNPHDVATLLKLYFRELPSPVIPSDTMTIFNNVDFSGAKSQHQQQLKNALGLLPLENYILLGTLCHHLSNLADYENCTKMNISNLGLIFCPTLQIGSVLFKNLLGGDGSDEERRRGLLTVWSDLESKHEEMENLEMIKDFEMGLELEKEEERLSKDRSNEHHNSRQQYFDIAQDNDNSKDRQSWEELDRSQLETTTTTHHSRVGSDPRRNGKVILSPDTAMMGSSHISPSTRTAKPPTETTFDLYDELMTKEIDEATSTPLIDFSVHDDNESEQAQLRWRRHAREPATNRRTESLPARGSATTTATTNTTRHERVPAVSVRY
ncbi:hypothetical protein BGZ97_000080 [Linnemannia gamsii]|uniref:Rho-GAP domain-containing protein n=1 Tax=Linnemannia gamsii TaxID=64522 RepID=A0A9P6QZE0_9FUNG|nr:hypothetical protein BGZ97_000080 [Linnemannia gamsii]